MHKNIRLLLIIILVLLISYPIWIEIRSIDFSSNYNIAPYEQAFLTSQYVGGTGIIPDETAYQYAAGHHIIGGSLDEVNPEVPPLGKYILGLSILIFDNTNQAIIIAVILSLISCYLLSRLIIDDSLIALIPVLLLVSGELFLDQLRYRPLLDIIHLPFILLSFYYFIRAQSEDRKMLFLLCGLMLGFVAVIKVMITAILIAISWLIFLIITRKRKQLLSLFLVTFTTAFIVVVVSYTKLFIDGHSFWYFLLVQKWVLFYQQSKILFPFSVWRLIFFNQWQTWWGDFSLLQARDWTIMWPISIVVVGIYGLIGIVHKIKFKIPEVILFCWVILYLAFLSLGTVSTRHLLPLLPFLYILGVQAFLQFFKKNSYAYRRKHKST